MRKVIKLYLNFTVTLSTVLLIIKSKLENIYGLKDGQKAGKTVLWVFSRDLGLQNHQEITGS